MRSIRTSKSPTIAREELLIDSMQGNSKDAGVAELGRINCEYSLQIESMDELIWEDNRELEKAYFDPFVKDKNAIKASLSKIEGGLKIKGDELEQK